MTYYDDDYAADSYAESQWEAQLIEDGVRELSQDRIREYLAKYGDAVEARIGKCTEDAHELSPDHPAIAVILACTAGELIIRYLILRPLVQGALLSDKWAEMLANKILGQRTASDRELLPAILRAEGIEINNITLADGRPIWPLFNGTIVPLRNEIVHRGASANAEQAHDAIECAEHMLSSIVEPMALRFGLSWPESGVWHQIEQGVGGATFSSRYQPEDPFI